MKRRMNRFLTVFMVIAMFTTMIPSNLFMDVPALLAGSVPAIAEGETDVDDGGSTVSDEGSAPAPVDTGASVPAEEPPKSSEPEGSMGGIVIGGQDDGDDEDGSTGDGDTGSSGSGESGSGATSTEEPAEEAEPKTYDVKLGFKAGEEPAKDQSFDFRVTLKINDSQKHVTLTLSEKNNWKAEIKDVDASAQIVKVNEISTVVGYVSDYKWNWKSNEADSALTISAEKIKKPVSDDDATETEDPSEDGDTGSNNGGFLTPDEIEDIIDEQNGGTEEEGSGSTGNESGEDVTGGSTDEVFEELYSRILLSKIDTTQNEGLGDIIDWDGGLLSYARSVSLIWINDGYKAPDALTDPIGPVVYTLTLNRPTGVSDEAWKALTDDIGALDATDKGRYTINGNTITWVGEFSFSTPYKSATISDMPHAFVTGDAFYYFQWTTDSKDPNAVSVAGLKDDINDGDTRDYTVWADSGALIVYASDTKLAKPGDASIEVDVVKRWVNVNGYDLVPGLAINVNAVAIKAFKGADFWQNTKITIGSGGSLIKGSDYNYREATTTAHIPLYVEGIDNDGKPTGEWIPYQDFTVYEQIGSELLSGDYEMLTYTLDLEKGELIVYNTKNVNINVTKKWVGGSANEREAVTFQLYKSTNGGDYFLIDSVTYTAAQAAGSEFTHTFTGLPLADSALNTFEYKVVEVLDANSTYEQTSAVYNENTRKYTFTNTKKNELKDGYKHIQVEKKWDGAPDDGWYAEFQIIDQYGRVVEFGEEGNKKTKLEVTYDIDTGTAIGIATNLPLQITSPGGVLEDAIYSIVETGSHPTGYVSSYGNITWTGKDGTIGYITVINKSETETVTVEKIWGDDAKTHPDVTVQITRKRAGSSETPEVVTEDASTPPKPIGTNGTLTLSDALGWKLNFNLPRYGTDASGTKYEYEYSLREVTIGEKPVANSDYYSYIYGTTVINLLKSDIGTGDGQHQAFVIKKDWLSYGDVEYTDGTVILYYVLNGISYEVKRFKLSDMGKLDGSQLIEAITSRDFVLTKELKEAVAKILGIDADDVEALDLFDAKLTYSFAITEDIINDDSWSSSAVGGYDGNGQWTWQITNTSSTVNELKKDLLVYKEWELAGKLPTDEIDDNKHDIEFYLLQNGKQYGDEPYKLSQGTYTLINVPVYDENNQPYIYTVEEVTGKLGLEWQDGFGVSYKTLGTNGIVITNEQKTIYQSITKRWSFTSSAESQRVRYFILTYKPTLIYTVYRTTWDASGNKTETVAVDTIGLTGWEPNGTYQIQAKTQLTTSVYPAYDENGNRYTYEVAETGLDWGSAIDNDGKLEYSDKVKYDAPTLGDFTITYDASSTGTASATHSSLNAYTSTPMVPLRIEKIWKGTAAVSATFEVLVKAPGSNDYVSYKDLDIRYQADFADYNKVVSITNGRMLITLSNPWTYDFELPSKVSDNSGYYEYLVEEYMIAGEVLVDNIAGDHMLTAYSEVGGTFSFTNTNFAEDLKITLELGKVWEDDSADAKPYPNLKIYYGRIGPDGIEELGEHTFTYIQDQDEYRYVILDSDGKPKEFDRVYPVWNDQTQSNDYKTYQYFAYEVDPSGSPSPLDPNVIRYYEIDKDQNAAWDKQRPTHGSIVFKNIRTDGPTTDYITLNLDKKWLDGDDDAFKNLRGQSVTVKVETWSVEYPTIVNRFYNIEASNSWHWELKLPKYDDKGEIFYKPIEVTLNEYYDLEKTEYGSDDGTGNPTYKLVDELDDDYEDLYENGNTHYYFRFTNKLKNEAGFTVEKKWTGEPTSIGTTYRPANGPTLTVTGQGTAVEDVVTFVSGVDYSQTSYPKAAITWSKTENEWVAKGLPIYDKSGNKYKYSIAELQVNGYEAPIYHDAKGDDKGAGFIGELPVDGTKTYSVENPFAKVNVSVVKKWFYDGNEVLPDTYYKELSVTYELWRSYTGGPAGGELVTGSSTLVNWSAANYNYKATWNNQPKYYVNGATIAEYEYFVKESVAIPGFNGGVAGKVSNAEKDTDGNLVVENHLDVMEIEVEKDLENEDDWDYLLGDITVTYKATYIPSGTTPVDITDSIKPFTGNSNSITLSSLLGWKNSFTKLPTHFMGKPITYTLTEAAKTGFEPVSVTVNGGTPVAGNTISVSRANLAGNPAKVSIVYVNRYKRTKIEGTKIWSGEDAIVTDGTTKTTIGDSLRPASITVDLYRYYTVNGTRTYVNKSGTESVTPVSIETVAVLKAGQAAGNTWTFETANAWDAVYVKSATEVHELHYYFEEQTVQYYTDISTPETEPYILRNKLDSTTIQIKKEWAGDAGHEADRPTKLEFKVYRYIDQFVDRNPSRDTLIGTYEINISSLNSYYTLPEGTNTYTKYVNVGTDGNIDIKECGYYAIETSLKPWYEDTVQDVDTGAVHQEIWTNTMKPQTTNGEKEWVGDTDTSNGTDYRTMSALRPANVTMQLQRKRAGAADTTWADYTGAFSWSPNGANNTYVNVGASDTSDTGGKFIVRTPWTFFVKGLPSYDATDIDKTNPPAYVYRVIEKPALINYDVAQTGMIVTNTLKTRDITVTKEWDQDFFKPDGKIDLPTSFKVKLVGKLNGTTIVEETIDLAVQTPEWSYTFTGLPIADSLGNKVVYTVVEVTKIPGVGLKGTINYGGESNYPATLTEAQINALADKETPVVITFTLTNTVTDTTKIKVEKSWDDSDNTTMRSNITYQLQSVTGAAGMTPEAAFAAGTYVEVETRTTAFADPTIASNWTAWADTFNNLPAQNPYPVAADGSDAVYYYRVVELTKDGNDDPLIPVSYNYTGSIRTTEEDETTLYTLNNVLKTKGFEFTKVWVDDDDLSGIRPLLGSYIAGYIELRQYSGATPNPSNYTTDPIYNKVTPTYGAGTKQSDNTWVWTYADELPAYRKEGTGIVEVNYYVVEKSTENLTHYTINHGNGANEWTPDEGTITNALGNYNMKGEKTWTDTGRENKADEYKLRPTELTITVMRRIVGETDYSTYNVSGSPVTTKAVRPTPDNGTWSWEITKKLPKYGFVGTKIVEYEYNFEETWKSIPEYQPMNGTGSVDEGNYVWSYPQATLANGVYEYNYKHENKLITTSVYVRKYWDDLENTQTTRPTRLKLLVSTEQQDAQGNPLYSWDVVLNPTDHTIDSNVWGIVLDKLPAYKGNVKLTYKVSEDLESSTNYVQTKLIDLKDPESDLTGIPTGAIDGYDGYAFAYYLENKLGKDDLGGEKKWTFGFTATDYSMYYPTSIKLSVYYRFGGHVKDLNAVDVKDYYTPYYYNDELDKPAFTTTNAKNGWIWTIPDVVQKKDNNGTLEDISIVIVEEWTYANGEKAFKTVYNVKQGATAVQNEITNELNLIDIEVAKKWDDAPALRQTRERPESITFTIKTKAPIDHPMVNTPIAFTPTANDISEDGNTWTTVISNLPQYYFNGKEFEAIKYWIEEETILGYELTMIVPKEEKDFDSVEVVSGEGNPLYQFKLENTLDPISVDITKKWIGDDDNKYGTRPDSITVYLMRGVNAPVDPDQPNGEKAWKEDGVFNRLNISEVLTSNANEKTTNAFTPLQSHDKDGNEFVYYTREEITGKPGVEPYGYTAKLTDANGNVLTVDGNKYKLLIENTLDVTKFEGAKVWHDKTKADVASGAAYDVEFRYRPQSVTMELWQKVFATSDMPTAEEWANNKTESRVKYGTGNYSLNPVTGKMNEFNWSVKVENLPKQTKTGEYIRYYLVEVTPTGYKEVGSAFNAAGVYEVHNYPEVTDMVFTKRWENTTNDEKLNIGTVRFELTTDTNPQMKVIKNVDAVKELYEGNRITFSGLPKYDGNGKVITYTLNEYKYNADESIYEKLTGFVTTIVPASRASDASNRYFEVTNTKDVLNIKVFKTWDDDFELYKNASLTVELLANGQPYNTPKTITLSESNRWEGTFTGLQVYDGEGKTITYTVKEDLTNLPQYRMVPGSNEIAYDDGNGTYTINLKNELITTDLNGEKLWDDNNDEHGTRPMYVEVELHRWYMAGSQKVEEQVFYSYGNARIPVTARARSGNGWTWSFEGFPTNAPNGSDYNYYVKEVVESTTLGAYETVQYPNAVINPTTGATMSGMYIRNNLITTDFKGLKVWEVPQDAQADMPASVQFELWYGTNATTPMYAFKENGVAVTLEAKGNDWTFEKNGLPMYSADGRLLYYFVLETSVSDLNGNPYSTTYAYHREEGSQYDVVVTNEWVPEEIPKNEFVDIPVTKNWADNNDALGTRPSQIVIYLTNKAGEIAGGPVALVEGLGNTSGNDWTYTFRNLPRYTDAEMTELEEYTLVEQVPEGYEASYQQSRIGHQGNGSPAVITNTPKTTSVLVRKVWSGGTNATRPSSVRITLYRDGTEVGRTTLRSSNDWEHTFDDQPMYSSNGTKYTYTITESSVTNYTVRYSKNGDYELIATNTYVPPTTNPPTTPTPTPTDEVTPSPTPTDEATPTPAPTPTSTPRPPRPLPSEYNETEEDLTTLEDALLPLAGAGINLNQGDCFD